MFDVPGAVAGLIGPGAGEMVPLFDHGRLAPAYQKEMLCNKPTLPPEMTGRNVNPRSG
jgi:hypothetical protein